MSVPVPIDELPAMTQRFGPAAYIVTVGADGRGSDRRPAPAPALADR